MKIIAVAAAIFLSQIGVAEARRHHVRHHFVGSNRSHVRSPNITAPVVRDLPSTTLASAFETPQKAVEYPNLNVSTLLDGHQSGIYYVAEHELRKPKKTFTSPERSFGMALSMVGAVVLIFTVCVGLDRRMKREKYDSGAYKD